MKQDKCRINNHILKQKLVTTTGREMRIPYKSEHSKEKINLTILMCQQLMSFIMRSLMTNEREALQNIQNRNTRVTIRLILIPLRYKRLKD